MSGRRRSGMAGRARGRVAAGAVLSRGVHPAGSDRRYRLSEQGCHLRPAVQGLIRDHAHHRSRSQASRRSHWHLVRPPHLGLGDDPSPACTHDRAGRAVLTRRKALGLMSATLLPVSGGAVSLVPPVVPGQAPRRLSGRCAAVLRQACPTDRSASIRRLSGAVVEHKLGGLLQTPLRGTEGVLRYLARYTHRVAISNRRLIACDDKGVTFKWKDYRLQGRERYKIMTLATHEFIRRFLMHVLPAGFHRIRYYGLLASGKRADTIARARQLLTLPIIPVDAIKAANTNADQPQTPEHRCPCCGGRMIIIERFERGSTPRYQPSPPTPVIRIDTS